MVFSPQGDSISIVTKAGGRVPWNGGALLPVPLEKVDAVPDRDGGNETVFVNNFVPSQKSGGVLLVPDEPEAFFIRRGPRSSMEKDQAGRGDVKGDTSHGRWQAG